MKAKALGRVLVVRALCSAVILLALVPCLSTRTSAQTYDCDYCCCGCFAYIQGSCVTTCACIIDFPPQSGNHILLMSCSTGFCECCGCCVGT
jgi:hypothetical protein